MKKFLLTILLSTLINSQILSGLVDSALDTSNDFVDFLQDAADLAVDEIREPVSDFTDELRNNFF